MALEERPREEGRREEEGEEHAPPGRHFLRRLSTDMLVTRLLPLLPDVKLLHSCDALSRAFVLRHVTHVDFGHSCHFLRSSPPRIPSLPSLRTMAWHSENPPSLLRMLPPEGTLIAAGRTFCTSTARHVIQQCASRRLWVRTDTMTLAPVTCQRLLKRLVWLRVTSHVSNPDALWKGIRASGGLEGLHVHPRCPPRARRRVVPKRFWFGLLHGVETVFRDLSVDFGDFWPPRRLAAWSSS